MTRVYYRHAVACVIVFDLSRRSTFYEVHKWKKDLDDKVHLLSGESVPCLLVANKADLADREVGDEEVEQLYQELGLRRYF